jgi:hypothetical protein
VFPWFGPSIVFFGFVVRRPFPSIKRDASYIMAILFSFGFSVPAIYSHGANYPKPPPLEIRSDRIQPIETRKEKVNQGHLQLRTRHRAAPASGPDAAGNSPSGLLRVDVQYRYLSVVVVENCKFWCYYWFMSSARRRRSQTGVDTLAKSRTCKVFSRRGKPRRRASRNLPPCPPVRLRPARCSWNAPALCSRNARSLDVNWA